MPNSFQHLPSLKYVTLNNVTLKYVTLKYVTLNGKIVTLNLFHGLHIPSF